MSPSIPFAQTPGSRPAPHPAVAALMAGVVDYAGLFPPAGLGMETAVANYARYRIGEHAAMLGRFVLPASGLESFSIALEALSEPEREAAEANPWELSVLAHEPVAVEVALAFERSHSFCRIGGFESRPARIGDVGSLEHSADGRELFVEIRWDKDPQDWLDVLAAGEGMAKIRTGGVEPEAAPPTVALARFLLRCHESGVSFKCTAGLHHPVRGARALTYENDAPRGVQHGFLNVFLAAILLDQDKLKSGELSTLLNEDYPSFFGLGKFGLEAGTHSLSAARISKGRRFLRSFGSCSFEEPIEDLISLELL